MLREFMSSARNYFSATRTDTEASSARVEKLIFQPSFRGCEIKSRKNCGKIDKLEGET